MIPGLYATPPFIDQRSGAWTPAITFDTAGDLTVAYTSQSGTYHLINGIVFASFVLVTSTFTHTTASGGARITGFPFTFAGAIYYGHVSVGGYTLANYTSIALAGVNTATYCTLLASGSAQNPASLTAVHLPTGGTIRIRGSIFYDA